MSRIIKNNYMHRSRNVTYSIFEQMKTLYPIKISISRYVCMHWAPLAVYLLCVGLCLFSSPYAPIQVCCFSCIWDDCVIVVCVLYYHIHINTYSMLLVHRICKALIASFWMACMHILCCTKIKRFCCRAASVPVQHTLP